jgi:rhodanese-related sulfurtransferase
MAIVSVRELVKPIFLAILLVTGEGRAQELNILAATTGENGQRTAEISTEQMRQVVADGSAIIIDTRPRAEFVNGHIPGANNLSGAPADPVASIAQLVSDDKAKPLVLYCNGPFCQASRRVSGLLVDAGFTNVRRYQLGMPIWRALGGPTQIELEGVVRIHRQDQTALFLDARSAEEFAQGSLPRAANLSADQAKTVQGGPMPLDDFNTRIVLFGRDGQQARALAEALSKRPWHNIVFYPGSIGQLQAALKSP